MSFTMQDLYDAALVYVQEYGRTDAVEVTHLDIDVVSGCSCCDYSDGIDIDIWYNTVSGGRDYLTVGSDLTDVLTKLSAVNE